ncbi:hypothetical protein KYB31_08635 [Clostridium felsineum]|uniref:hypothetical protein n=1 Tax=Clostridium felsineum TaxID=36839 RepID=UPI00214DD3FE|nr:hypothetical protein [Clostridium felsineum]MCR3759055.1 hypothetical protein [Clostridium felsineum]
MLYILIILCVVIVSLIGVKIIVSRKAKTSLTVFADIAQNIVLEETETKGTRVLDDYGRRYELLINVKVKNSGDNGFEITSIFIEIEFENGAIYEVKIMPDTLPKVVEEGESIDISIQKEWIDYENVNSFGVIDSKGRHYYLPKEKLDKLWIASNELPSTKDSGRIESDPSNVIEAFEARDKSIFIKKN